MSSQVQDSATMKRTGKKVVMVVEDDRPVGELLASIINDEEGYYAIHVTRPTEALETLKNVKPDLLVLDVGLPGMSGIELYDRVQRDERLKLVPVMFETAVAYENRDAFKQRGIDHVVEKPFDVDEIVRCVRKLAPRDMN
ncbi:MAG: response regulator [Chloroflexota bacterium]|nr:response regulator [Chloroflexota bacterium]